MRRNSTPQSYAFYRRGTICETDADRKKVSSKLALVLAPPEKKYGEQAASARSIRREVIDLLLDSADFSRRDDGQHLLAIGNERNQILKSPGPAPEDHN